MACNGNRVGCGSCTIGILLSNNFINNAFSLACAAGKVCPLGCLFIKSLLIDFGSGVPRGICTLRYFELCRNNTVLRLFDVSKKLPKRRNRERIGVTGWCLILEPRHTSRISVVHRPIFVCTVFAFFACHIGNGLVIALGISKDCGKRSV